VCCLSLFPCNVTTHWDGIKYFEVANTVHARTCSQKDSWYHGMMMNSLRYTPDDPYNIIEPVYTWERYAALRASETGDWDSDLFPKKLSRMVCVFHCFIKPISGNRYVRSRGFIVGEPRETHPRSEIADVPTSSCPSLDNLGCLHPQAHLPPYLCRWLHRSPPLPLDGPTTIRLNGPTTIRLTTKGLCLGGSVV